MLREIRLGATRAEALRKMSAKLQIEELEHFILDANKKSIRNAYIIVGKGDGVLRKEVKKVCKQKKLSFAEIANPPYFGNAIKVTF